MAAKHKQVKIEWKETTAEVDEGIAPLILALWRVNIDTINSCQENRPGVAWVEFASTQGAREFLNLVAVYPSKDELHIVNDRMYVGEVPFWETLYARASEEDSPGGWIYNVYPVNYGLDEEIIDNEMVTTQIGPSDFEFTVSVRFPTTDIPKIIERLNTSESVKGKGA